MSRALEEVTPWNSLSARGTVRLALKKAGLDAAQVNKGEMLVVLDRLMPQELRVRGIADADQLCADLRTRLEVQAFDTALREPARPEDVFRRVLGRSATANPGS